MAGVTSSSPELWQLAGDWDVPRGPAK